MFKTLKAKLVLFFTLSALLALTCGAMGLFGIHRLSQSLDFITTAAWDAADGSMGTQIGVEAEMLAMNDKLNGEIIQEGTQVRTLEESEKFTKEAFDRMLGSGLLTNEERDSVTKKYADFKQRCEALATTHTAFVAADKNLAAEFARFQNLMAVAAEHGKREVELLGDNPIEPVYWAGGLSTDWAAAKAAMEANIYLLDRYYQYQQIVENHAQSDTDKALARALAGLEEKLREMDAVPAFNNSILSGPEKGRAYRAMFAAMLEKHKATFLASLAAWQNFQQDRHAYVASANDLRVTMDHIEKIGSSKVEGETDNLIEVKFASRAITLAAMGLALLVTLGAAWYGIRRIANPLTTVVRTTTELAAQFSTAAVQIAASGLTLSEASTEQASAVEETSAALEQLASMTVQNSDHANEARNLATQARQSVDDGAKSIDEMNRVMNETKAASDAVGKILKTIEEIAFQTNILALNAAVEAARAGDAGRGFAVVAEEVRNLAKRCTDAAKESAVIIETAVDKSGRSVTTARDVTALLTEIGVKVRKVSDLIAEISSASLEQSQGIGQVNQSVQQMDKALQNNASTAEETAATAEQMSGQVSALAESADRLAQMAGVVLAKPVKAPAQPHQAISHTASSPAAHQADFGPMTPSAVSALNNRQVAPSLRTRPNQAWTADSSSPLSKPGPAAQKKS